MAVTPKIRVKVLPQSKLRLKFKEQKLRLRAVPAIPGTPGDDGDAATIAVGSVTTLPPGSSATVANVGTSAAAVFNFGIPAGEDGAGAVESVNGATGVVVLDADDIDDTSTTNKFATAAELSKLAGIATGATANSSDATLLARANHTGTQLAAPISDFSTAADARISAAIGVTVQAYSANLAEWSGINPSANGGSLVAAADYAAMRALLDLEAGTDFLSPAAIAAAYQPLDGDLTSWAGVTRASGFDTFAATPSSANLAALLTDETGTGSAVFATSPAITTPTVTGPLTINDDQASTLFMTTYNNAGATAGAFVMRRARGTLASPSATLSGDTIAGINARGYGDNAFSSLGRATFSFRAAETWTNSAQGTDFMLETTTIGGTSRVQRLVVQLGLLMGTATGGDKGAGTINATAVYDDNTLLTCMAMSKEFIEAGTVDIEKWDSFVPDLTIPERRETVEVLVDVQIERDVTERAKDGSLVRRKVIVTEKLPAVELEPVWDDDGNGVDAVEIPITEEVVTPAQIVKREHRTARVFKAMLDSGFDPRDPEQYFAKMQAEEALPGMPTQADWTHNGLSIGEQFSRKWLAMEMLAIVCNVMWAKLQDHEARLSRLESVRVR